MKQRATCGKETNIPRPENCLLFLPARLLAEIKGPHSQPSLPIRSDKNASAFHVVFTFFSQSLHGKPAILPPTLARTGWRAITVTTLLPAATNPTGDIQLRFDICPQAFPYQACFLRPIPQMGLFFLGFKIPESMAWREKQCAANQPSRHPGNAALRRLASIIPGQPLKTVSPATASRLAARRRYRETLETSIIDHSFTESEP